MGWTIDLDDGDSIAAAIDDVRSERIRAEGEARRAEARVEAQKSKERALMELFRVHTGSTYPENRSIRVAQL